MNTNTVYDATDGTYLGYWFYSNLSPDVITAVRADGTRATAPGMNQAERWIRA
jgi:hypothetical protein